MFKDKDYLMIVGSGGGIHPNDKGKLVIYHASLANVDSLYIRSAGAFKYDTCIEFISGIDYTTAAKSLPVLPGPPPGGYKYACAKHTMFRKATQEEVIKGLLLKQLRDEIQAT